MSSARVFLEYILTFAHYRILLVRLASIIIPATSFALSVGILLMVAILYMMAKHIVRRITSESLDKNVWDAVNILRLENL
jgi:hypothetical protein